MPSLPHAPIAPSYFFTPKLTPKTRPPVAAMDTQSLLTKEPSRCEQGRSATPATHRTDPTTYVETLHNPTLPGTMTCPRLRPTRDSRSGQYAVGNFNIPPSSLQYRGKRSSETLPRARLPEWIFSARAGFLKSKSQQNSHRRRSP